MTSLIQWPLSYSFVRSEESNGSSISYPAPMIAIPLYYVSNCCQFMVDGPCYDAYFAPYQPVPQIFTPQYPIDTVEGMKEALFQGNFDAIFAYGKTQGWENLESLRTNTIYDRYVAFTKLMIRQGEVEILEKMEFDFRMDPIEIYPQQILEAAINHYANFPRDPKAQKCILLILKRYIKFPEIRQGLLYVFSVAAKSQDEVFEEQLLLAFPEMSKAIDPRHSTLVLKALKELFPNEEPLLKQFPYFRTAWEPIRKELALSVEALHFADQVLI